MSARCQALADVSDQVRIGFRLDPHDANEPIGT